MKYKFLFFSLASILFGACSSSSSKAPRSASASSIGQPSEVLLVLDKEVMASDLKDTLKSILECDIPGLNQSESFFRVSRVPMSIYKGEMLKMHSQLLVQIKPSQKNTELKLAFDVDAKPQIQLLLLAPSIPELRTYLQKKSDRLRQMLLDHQLEMLQVPLKRHYSKVMQKELKKMGYKGLLPEEIAWAKSGKDFVWGSSRTNEKQMNVVMYKIPDDEALLDDLNRMVQVRDSVMEVNIPGSQPDQWMETVWEEETPIALLSKRMQDSLEITEIHGLWQMRHGAMGGPFLSYLWRDGEGNIVVLEGFIYSPSTQKRELIRRLEASMRTVKAI